MESHPLLWTFGRRKQMLHAWVLPYIHGCFHPPHTAENIKTKYQEILGQYGLDVTDTFRVVCDNASNMKKAFKLCLWEAEVDDKEEVEEELDIDMENFPLDRAEQRCLTPTIINHASYTHCNYWFMTF